MNFKTSIMLIIGIWIGLVLGLSFIEAPLKFMAPGISTKLGLGIGRLVFSVSNKIQIALFLLFLGLYCIQLIRLSLKGKISTLILLAIIALQTLFLLPLLDARAQMILNDHVVADSYHHHLFVVLEIIKLISLFTLYFNIQKHD